MDIGGPMYVYLLLAFILIYLPTISVGKCNNLQDVSSLSCSKKYLSESYFNKHDILIDSNFKSFLEHEFPLCSCKSLDNLNTVIKVPVLHRDLIGEGSHRRLFSSLRVSIQPHTTISELPEHFCEAIVIERLPSGVFADPFELQHLVQRGVFVDAAVFGDTNLELPSALSNRSVVEVHMDIGHNILSKHTDALEINLELPLHARYPPLDGSGYSKVEMGIPDLFIRCTTEHDAACERCLWAKAAEHVKSPADTVLWRIPSGNKAHSQNHVMFINLVRAQNPDLIFLAETKIPETRMIQIAQTLGYLNYVRIDTIGLAGGLILMRKDGITCDVAATVHNTIHVLIKLHPAKEEVLLSCMYGSPYVDDKMILWNYLQELSENLYQPWL